MIFLIMALCLYLLGIFCIGFIGISFLSANIWGVVGGILGMMASFAIGNYFFEKT